MKQIKGEGGGMFALESTGDPCTGSGAVTPPLQPRLCEYTAWNWGSTGRLVGAGAEQRGGLSPVSWLLTKPEPCHLLTPGCIERRCADSPRFKWKEGNTNALWLKEMWLEVGGSGGPLSFSSTPTIHKSLY